MKNKVALVIGSAKGVEEEVSEALRSFPINVVIATNSIVADFWWRIDAAVTLHPSLMRAWRQTRIDRGWNMIPRYIAHRNEQASNQFDFITDVLDYHWPEQLDPTFPAVNGVTSGSSGHYAIKAALELFEANKVILAGVPMRQDRCHYNSEAQWNVDIFLPAWRATYGRLAPFVRSMSGWTADQFGKPDLYWAKH